MLLPSVLRLRSRSYLEGLYAGRHLSARQIARMTEVSRSVVPEALDRFGIPQNRNRHKHPGQLNRRLVPTKINGIWQDNTVRGILARV